jgi:hypothetical protein
VIYADTTPHWPRRAGLGGIIEDQLQQAALSSQAWSDVQVQLNAEGADNLKVLASKETFVNAFQSLVAPANGFAVDSGSALDAAKQLTIIGQTALGAVSTVSGLIHDLSTESPQQITQAFTGGLVALAVGAGAISAGIGAAIVAGVGAIIDVLQSSGLFSPPAGVQLQGCGGTYYNPPPTTAVGCIPGWCDPNIVQVKPGSNNWRSFPKPGDSSDRPWFLQNNPAVGPWKGVTWGGCTPASNFLDATLRPIDVAFPNYSWVEHGATQQFGAISISPITPGSHFMQGFASAWRANAEYAFNGLKPQPDEQVLLHFLRLWNRSNGPPTETMRQGGYGSYAESLVTAVLNQDNTFASGDGGLLINSGGPVQPPATSGASSTTGGLVSSSAVSGGMSTGGKIAAGAAIGGGVILLGTAGYAAYSHQSLGQVWTRVMKKVRLKR